VDTKRIAGLIAALDSDQFTVRAQATRQLEKLGLDAEPALRKALAGRPPLEVRRRLEGLLERLDGTEGLRASRALEALERIGSPAARQLLETLAERVPGGRLSEEANATSLRLSRRSGSDR
jgi:hypothetical protein